MDNNQFSHLDLEKRWGFFQFVDRTSSWLDGQWSTYILSQDQSACEQLNAKGTEVTLTFSKLLPEQNRDDNISIFSIHFVDIYLLAEQGGNYLDEYEDKKSSVDLAKSLALLSHAVTMIPDNDIRRPMISSHYAIALSKGFDKWGNMIDLDNAIIQYSKAISQVSGNDDDLPIFLNNQGIALQTRFEKNRDKDDIDNAISNKSEAVRLTLDDHPSRAARLSDLGEAYRRRFESFSNKNDLLAAIKFTLSAKSLTSHDDLRQLNNLGALFEYKFQRLGNLEDLDLAINYLREALSLGNDQDKYQPSRYNNLGAALQTRFGRTGNIVDLDSAISYLMSAIKLTGDSDPDKPSWLSNLSVALQRRYGCQGHLADLDAAIAHEMLALTVELISDGHLNKAVYLANLGDALYRRFEKSGELADIEDCIKYKLDVLSLTSDEHSDKPRQLNNLGRSYQSKFEKFRDFNDLDSAVSYHCLAVDLSTDRHPNKPQYLGNLALALYGRYKETKVNDDAIVSMAHLSHAIILTPASHPYLSRLQFNLGEIFSSRFDILQSEIDIKAAIDHFSTAAMSAASPPTILFQAAVKWMDLAHQFPSITRNQELLRACATALGLLPRLAWIGQDLHHRLDQLVDIPTVASDAAACAIEQKNFELAIEWLEQGRSVVWRQMLQIRSPFNELRKEYPKLALELEDLSHQLEQGSLQSSENQSLSLNLRDLETVAQEYRANAERWEKLLNHIHTLPGFKMFLQPKTFADLRLAACIGPIIILNASQYHCDCLIISPLSKAAQHIPLEITYSKLQEFHQKLSCYEGGRSSEDTSERRFRPGQVKEWNPLKTCLSELWVHIGIPVIDKLGLKDSDSLSHIWWCPTSAFASLPIHAAGDYTKVDDNITKYAISSYTTHLEILANNLAKKNSVAPFKLLAISQSNTPKMRSLPNTIKELEVIQKLIPPPIGVYLEGVEGTVEKSLLNLADACWCHFACHGIQDLASPLESAFQLQDGPLKLAMIIQKSLPYAELAFLSACETAMGNNRLADEATHLAAGLQFAGFKSVIATLWSIHDVDGPIVAEAVYKYLLGGGKRPDASKSAEALHYAVLALQEQGKSLERWVPFIHIGC
ncbi:hypothetical protein JAAARDRAFT_139813 [Jaapia argillacea MUCL 33604]|uniref:CHAT domain-containing protein n=1 Tax=Jaapia argillacea MUCL 33604 TaxID=933084 RepID=A0A067PAG3_9AGAM|nr:hypothetical protein JAAARDRAFT_139813 [Jaapia argillacea MUCL 33604]